MNKSFNFQVPFTWCPLCNSFNPAVSVMYDDDISMERHYYCTNAPICRDCMAAHDKRGLADSLNGQKD